MVAYQILIMQLIVGYTCVGVFVATAIISILSLLRVLKLEEGQANKLFTILIVEVVAISVAVYAGLINVSPAPVTNKLEAGQEAAAKLDDAEQKFSEVSKSLAETNQALTAVETVNTLNAPANTVALKPRIYIHIADEKQRSLAKRGQVALKDAGDLVPGIQNVGANSPSQTEVRYFLDADKQDAEKIAQTLKAAGIDAAVRFVSGMDTSKIRPRHFELWFEKT